jgi:hypothetical protein
MPGINEYDELLEQQDQERSSRVSRALYLSADSNADREAGFHNISRRSGVPVEALRLDDGAEAKRRIASKEAENLGAVAPATANWLSSPDNARLAHDDVEKLAQLERAARQGFGQQASGGSTLGIATPSDQRAAARAKSIGSAFVEGLASSPEKVSEGLATVPVVLADLVNWSLEAFPDETGMRKRFADNLRGNVDYWKNAGDAKKSETAPQSAESYFQQAGGSIGTSLLAAPFGLAGKDAALAAFALFADGGYQEMKDKGVPVPMAAALSTSSSIMEGLTEKIGLDQLYKGSAPVLKKALGFLLGDLAGEEINALYSAISDKVTVKPDMTMGDVLQQVIDTAIVTSIAGPAQGVSMSGAAKVSGSLFDQFQAQQEARRQSNFLLALGDSAKATKTFGRLPSAVQDLVREIKKDGAVQDVYVPVERFTELFQSQGMDPGKAAEQILSDPARFYEAVATGGDVAIPLEEFARLADAPFYGELVKDARTSLTGMTAREAEGLGDNEARINDLMAQAAEADPLPEGEGYETAYQQIYDDTYGQLIGVNQAPGEAEANATIRAKGLATLAQRYGYDPAALMEQFPLTVTRGDLPAALQRQPSFTEQQQGAQLSAMLDAIRSGKSKDPGEMFGPSLGEFLRTKGINDDRGDLAAMDVDKGIKFKKKMLRKDGMSLDKAREAAAEAGYLPADSTTADLLNLVDSELRGNPTYAPGNINQSLVDQQDSHDELAQWLGMMGVDLGETDNEKILQMMQEAVAGGDQLDQGAVDTKSEAFKKWFGKSKVVDEKGEPLVVYHGTGSDFTEFDGRAYFTADAGQAMDYANNQDDGKGNAKTIAAYLSLQNPLTVSDDYIEWAGNDLDEIRKVQANGYDGMMNVSMTEIVAFSPTQIKSIFNRGTFDPSNPNILFQSAWHGSPHTFDKFTTSAIGTGEGAQAYGYGLYFAGNKEVAEYYKKALGDSTSKINADYSALPANAQKKLGEYLASGNTKAQMISQAKDAALMSRAYDAQDGGKEREPFAKEMDVLADWLEGEDVKVEKVKGRLYSVELAPSEDEYLLWDKPLSEQSEKVQGLLVEAGFEITPERTDLSIKEVKGLNGNIFYRVVDGEGGQVGWDNDERSGAEKELSRHAASSGDIEGRYVYHDTQNQEGSPSAASEYLHSLGIRGIKYLDGSSRGKGDGDFNYVIFSEDDVAITQMFQAQKVQQKELPKRAYIKINDSLPGFEIALLKDADASSFLHEMGHYYEVILGRLAAQEGAPEQLKADYQTVLAWLGATDKESLTVEQREKFARGFEAYLYEGNAPSQELRGVFQRFKVWLKAVYSSLKSLNVELSDDVRGVFDRLLATDEEIAAAEREQNVKPMYATAEDAGMSAAVFEAYKKLAEQAHEEAKDKLEQAKLREVKRAHESWWKEARAKMAEEVEAEAKQDPVFEALNFIRTGKLFDGSVYEGESFRISGDELLKAYDSGTLKGIRKRLGNVYAKKGGISPAVVAEMFGFSSVDELVKKMMEAPKLRDFVKAETDRRMEEVHGKMNSAEIAEEAINAVFNDDQAKLLREELKAINRKRRDVKPFTDVVKGEGKAALSREKAEREYERRWFEAEKALALAIEKGVASVEIDRLKGESERLKAEISRGKAERAYELRWMEAERRLAVAIEKGAKQAEIDDLKESIKRDKAQARAAQQFDKDTVPPVAAFQESARRHIATLKVSEILPGKYSRAEAKASQESFILNGKGKYSEAAAAKTRQLLNHYLFREATAAKAEADKIASNMRKLESAKAQARIGKAGADYLDQVNALLEQYEFKRQTGKVLAERERLIDWVERMEKLNGFPPPIPAAILEESLQINFRTLTMQELRDVNDAVKAITFMARMQGKMLKVQAGVEAAQVIKFAVDSIEANGGKKRKRQPEKNLPQDKPGKHVRNYLSGLRTMSSLAREMDGHVDGGVIWNMLIRPLNEAGDNEAVMQSKTTDTANDIFSVYSGKERAMMVIRRVVPGTDLSLSHWGRLVTVMNMGNEGNLQRLQNNFTSGEMRAILDSLDGRDLQFVQNVWNWIGSFKEEIGAQHKRLHGIEPAWVDATPLPTKYGTLQGGYFPLFYDLDESERAAAQAEAAVLQQMESGAFSRAMTKDGHTIQRLDKVGRKLDLDISNIFNHVNQVIHDLTHHETLIDLNRLLAKEDLQNAMRDYYGPEAFKVFRDGITDVAVGGLNAKNAFERMSQYLRVGVTTSVLGWKVTTSLLQPMGLFQSMVRIGPKWVVKGVVKWASSDKSMVAVAREIYEKSPFMRERSKSMNRELAEVNSKIEPGVIPDVVRGSFFYLIQEMQKTVDIPTWLGQYEKSLAEHGNEADAIAEADQAVIDSQAHGQMKDLARLHRGGPLMKIFTMFSSYFVRTWNLAAERFDDTNFKSPAEAGKFTVDMMLLYVIPAVIQALVFDYAIQILIGGDPDEDMITSKILSNILGSIVAPFPGIREVAAASASVAGYEGPAGTRFYSEVGRLVTQIRQGEADAVFWKSLANTAGMVVRAPSGQIVKTVEGMKEIADGRGNLLSLFFGKPKK